MNKQKMGLSNRLFYLFNSVVWVVVMAIVLYPLYLVIISSISDPYAVVRGEVLWRPVDVSFMGYEAIMEYKQLWASYLNSLIYTVSSVVLSLFVTLTAAYALSRKGYAGKAFLNFFFIFTMFFGGGLIPTFLVMKDIGLYNTPWIMILMGCVNVWNLMVARTYMQNSIPEDLYEAAALDGASHFQYFGYVVVPLSKTIMAVLSVYYGVAKWNDYFTGVIYLKDQVLYPLQTVLKGILASLQVNLNSEYMLTIMDNIEAVQEAVRIANAVKYCVIVVSTVPVVILYFFVQKYFEKGVMIGSLKG